MRWEGEEIEMRYNYDELRWNWNSFDKFWDKKFPLENQENSYDEF